MVSEVILRVKRNGKRAVEFFDTTVRFGENRERKWSGRLRVYGMVFSDEGCHRYFCRLILQRLRLECRSLLLSYRRVFGLATFVEISDICHPRDCEFFSNESRGPNA